GVGPRAAGANRARRKDGGSVGITRGHLARDLGTLFEVAANDQLRRRRARAVSLLIPAVTAIEARDHPQPPVPARRLGVDQRLHLVAPLLAFVGAADVAQIVQGAEDLGEPLQAAVERRHPGLGARRPANRRKGERGRKRGDDVEASLDGCLRRHEGLDRDARALSRLKGTETRQANDTAAGRLPTLGASVVHVLGRSASRSNASATISARPAVVGNVASSPGSSQRASSSSSLRTGSPAEQRAANHGTRKCLSPRPSPSRPIASRNPASATGSIVIPVSSRTSRVTASSSVSPTSTTPPGRVKRPCAGARARRTTRILPSRTMAALTAR